MTPRRRTAADLALGLALLVAFFVVTGVVGLVRDADLRNLDELRRTTATVVDAHRSGTHGRDDYEVAFTVDGRRVEASVPVIEADVDVREVEVAHVPDEPHRVRTVEGWYPWARFALERGLVAVVLGAVALPLLRRYQRRAVTPAAAG